MSSISLAGVQWHAPDNTLLFNDLNLTFGSGRTGLVGRNGAGKSTLLRLIAGELRPRSGAITVAGTVGVLHQTPEEVGAATLADLFEVRDQLAGLARAERGDAPPEELAELDWTLEPRLARALGRLGLDHPLSTPLAALSGGQRTRAALAALLFAEPDILLLDEPTNHLDGEGRQHVAAALRGWRGCAVVASHDRALLEEMEVIVELSQRGGRRYGGGYHAFRAAQQAERAEAEAALAQAQRRVAETAAQAQRAAERKARTDRQGRQLRASGSQSKLLLDAAQERSEGSGQSAARLRRRQAEAAETALTAARDAVEVLEPLVMEIPPSGLAPTREVLRVEGLHFGYDRAAPVLSGVSLAIRGPERVALEGRNGAGKSTLLGCIAGRLCGQSGALHLGVPAALIDQDLSLLHPEETVRDAFARIDPKATENARRAVLARFLFRGAEADRRVATLSGGQRMRAGLAVTLGHSQPRQLLLLDEPSNHLDLDAVATLEAALSAYDGALLVVSHDAAFLERIGTTRRFRL